MDVISLLCFGVDSNFMNKKQVSSDTLAITAALHFSHIDPLSVEAVEAYWIVDDREEGGIGAILRTNRPIRHSYVVHRWDRRTNYQQTSTQQYREFPEYLLERARDWKIDVAKINASLGYAKANAKYGPPSSAIDPFKTD